MTATPPYHTTVYSKFADETLDYAVDWTAWIQPGDGIVESTWTPDDPGLVVVSDSFTATTTTVWISGGPTFPPGSAVGATLRCEVVNHISTGLGRQDDFVLVFDVRQA